MELTSAVDDFFVNLNLQTVLELPTGRETVLGFFEVVQKEFPAMANFYYRDSGAFMLEGERDSGSYPWLEIHKNRLSSGCFNPPEVEEAYRQHRWVLERGKYYLGLSGLDLECLDVVFGFNLDFHGNRDSIIAQALLDGSPLSSLTGEPGARTLECEPSVVVSLDEACCLQARISVETRSSSFQVRTGQYENEPITIYLTVRRYPGNGGAVCLEESVVQQCQECEDLARRVVIPQVIQPIVAAIAAAR